MIIWKICLTIFCSTIFDLQWCLFFKLNFRIYKSEDRAQATSIFNSLSRKLHVLANASAILDVGMVQNLSKAIYNHPTYGYAHIACYLGLPDLLSNANIARWVAIFEFLNTKYFWNMTVEKKNANVIFIYLFFVCFMFC